MKALCVKSYSDLQQLTSGQVETIEVTLVERDVADNVENGLQKLLPYVVFYNMDISAGKLKFVQYLRAAAAVAEGEQPQPRFTSVGFGKFIEMPESLRSRETIIGENGEESYAVNLSDLLDLSVVAGMNDVLEVAGVDVKALFGQVIDANDLAFFNSQAPDDMYRTVTGVAIPVALTSEQFDLFLASKQINPAFVEQIDTLGINIDRIVEEMDITPTIDKVIGELVERHSLEAFSAMMFNYIARKELFNMLKDVNYADIVALVHAKRAQLQQIGQETIANEQAAAAASAQAAAIATGQETYEVNGMTSLAQPGGHVASTDEVKDQPQA